MDYEEVCALCGSERLSLDKEENKADIVWIHYSNGECGFYWICGECVQAGAEDEFRRDCSPCMEGFHALVREIAQF